MMRGSIEPSREPNRKEIKVLTLREAQEIFIDAMPGMEIQHEHCTPATDAEPTYVEYWQYSAPAMSVIWYDGPDYPVMIEIDADLTGSFQRDIVDPEDVESVVARLTRN